MGHDIVIRVEGLWKRYGLPVPAAVRSAAAFLRGNRDSHDGDGPWALQEVNLEVRRGETVGIIGRNGAGKSTLLKVLAGVSAPTRGRVEVRGRVFPMIELNAGLHMELTGRENIRLLGAIMGLSRREIESKIPEIQDFCELGEWFDKPVRTYSSGMLARLGFGVAVNVESDIILIDETFAVGDLKFQNKSLARVKEMRESGATVLLVSHSLDTLQFVAARGVLLERGRVVAGGSSRETINAYETLVFRSEQERLQHKVRNRISSQEVMIHHARIVGDGGETITEVRAGNPFGVEVDLSIGRELERPLFSLGIVNAAGILCMWNISEEDGFTRPETGGRCRVRAWYESNHLATGAYEVHFAVRDASSFETLERIAGAASFAVIGPRRSRGVVAELCRWDVVPVGPGT
ncbi:MAG: ABC transporter ATP-binding protein [Desulfomonile sp.]|nr:ABC transporter ATP-binding protein [Desulfomonile sp.]